MESRRSGEVPAHCRFPSARCAQRSLHETRPSRRGGAHPRPSPSLCPAPAIAGAELRIAIPRGMMGDLTYEIAFDDAHVAAENLR
jgi:hypothetical protein